MRSSPFSLHACFALLALLPCHFTRRVKTTYRTGSHCADDIGSAQSATMAPKKPYKVHSLNKHVEDTQKGISAEAQYNRHAGAVSALKVDSAGLNASIFGNNDDDESNSDTDGSSDEEPDQQDFLRKLTQTSSAPKKPAANTKKSPAKNNVDKVAAASKPAAKGAVPAESDTSSTSSSDAGSDEESSSDDAEPKTKSKPKTNGAARPAAAATATTTTSPTSSSGEDESSDEEDASKQNGVKLQKPSTKESSSEEESGSGSEESGSDSEESEAEAPKKPTTNGKAVAPAARQTQKSSSESESESESGSDAESESDEEPSQGAKKAAPSAKAAVPKPAAKATSPDSESASESEDNGAVDESMHISDREENNQLAGPKFIAPDFMIRRGDEVNGKDVAEVCNQANLQGKQFWYFTVPSDIPISVVQNMEIPLDTAQRSDSVFSHNGDSYGVSFDNMTPKSTIQILIPSADGIKYQAAPRSLDQVVQVKRITNLGGSSTGTADPTYQRPVRPQPKGLKARYKPIGVSKALGTIGDDLDGDEADTEMADAPALPELPVAETTKEKKKRKSKAATEAEPVSETPKKSKKKDKASGEADLAAKGKRKLTSSEEDAFAASSQLMGESQVAETKSKKQKTGRAGSPDLSTKVTPVTVPAPSFSFDSLPDAAAADASTPKAAAKKTSSKKKAAPAEPAAKATPIASAKKPKKAAPKVEVPVPSSSQVTIPAIGRNTPIAPPVIYGQPIPSSSAPPASTPTPAAKTTKKSGGGKKKEATQANSS